VAVLFPPREYKPAHVQVTSATGVVVIELANGALPQGVRKIEHMSRPDICRAERIVADNTELLLTRWRQIWDE
jgi:hypothetical protein